MAARVAFRIWTANQIWVGPPTLVPLRSDFGKLGWVLRGVVRSRRLRESGFVSTPINLIQTLGFRILPYSARGSLSMLVSSARTSLGRGLLCDVPSRGLRCCAVDVAEA